MEPTSLLSQLRDVHGPESIGAWPPAIGWIIMVLLISATSVTIVWLTIRWFRTNAWRRAALKEFTLLQKQYLLAPTNLTLIELSSLIKRCSASVNMDTSMLAMSGAPLKNLLQTPNSPLTDKEVHLLCFDHYKPNYEQLDRESLLRIRKWIKTLSAIPQSQNQATQNQQETAKQSNTSDINNQAVLPDINDTLENKTS